MLFAEHDLRQVPAADKGIALHVDQAVRNNELRQRRAVGEGFVLNRMHAGREFDAQNGCAGIESALSDDFQAFRQDNALQLLAFPESVPPDDPDIVRHGEGVPVGFLHVGNQLAVFLADQHSVTEFEKVGIAVQYDLFKIVAPGKRIVPEFPDGSGDLEFRQFLAVGKRLGPDGFQRLREPDLHNPVTVAESVDPDRLHAFRNNDRMQLFLFVERAVADLDDLVAVHFRLDRQIDRFLVLQAARNRPPGDPDRVGVLVDDFQLIRPVFLCFGAGTGDSCQQGQQNCQCNPQVFLCHFATSSRFRYLYFLR